MDTGAMRRLTLVAGFAWLVVAGYGVREATVDDEGAWRLAYLLFSIALLVGAAATVSLATLASRKSGRPRLRIAGLVVSGLGCALALVAWALPVWMTVLGVGFAIVAVSSAPRPRRALALLAAGHLVGVAVMFVGIAAEVGRRDEYGDYPAAGGIAVGVVAAMTIIALVQLGRSIGHQGPPQGDQGLALEVSRLA
jgi:hypothetical protein